MSKPKFTPGPWAVFNGTDIFHEDDFMAECQIADCLPSRSKVTVQVARSNAKLFAASFDLLTGVKELLAADDAMTAFILAANPKQMGEAAWEAEREARAARRTAATVALRAAIAKAEAS